VPKEKATSTGLGIDLRHSGLKEGRTRMRAFRASSPRAWCPTASLGVLAFWGGMVMAGRRYPSEYDWRYITISSLVYGDRNPSGYLWARAGIVLCGLAGLYWTTVLARQGRQAGFAQRPIGVWALGLGYLCMACCALLPEGLIQISKGHDFLALAAFVGLCVGMMYTTFTTVERSARGRAGGNRRLYAGVLAGVPLCPIVLAALAQAHISHALPGLPWVSLAWRARGVPVYLSFACWEWVTCAVFSMYMMILSRTTRAAHR
jgi:hypothetical protein